MALEAVLELALVDQAGLEFTEICWFCLLSAGIKGVCHHCLAASSLLRIRKAGFPAIRLGSVSSLPLVQVSCFLWVSPAWS